MDLEFEIQIFIESHQKSNGNKCGLSITTIMSEFSLDFKDLKPILSNLHQNKKNNNQKRFKSIINFYTK